MSNIKNEDMDKNKNDKLTAAELEQVKGGPAYLKIGDIKGESRVAGDGKHDKWIDILSTSNTRR